MPVEPHRCRVTPEFLPDHWALFERLRDDVNWTDHMRSRHTASMGVPYNYSGASYPVSAWHPEVEALAERLTPVVGFRATNCLLNYYPTGRNSVGWHSDDTTILAPGTGIAILSLGTTRELELRANTDAGFHYEALPLEGGSLCLMSAQMQSDWRHSLRRADATGPRISLSFRHIVRWPETPPVVTPRGRTGEGRERLTTCCAHQDSGSIECSRAGRAAASGPRIAARRRD